MPFCSHEPVVRAVRGSSGGGGGGGCGKTCPRTFLSFFAPSTSRYNKTLTTRLLSYFSLAARGKVERAEICACYRLHGPIARICDTGSRYGRLDLRAGAPRCVPRMRTYIGVSNDREEKGEREEAACQGQS